MKYLKLVVDNRQIKKNIVFFDKKELKKIFNLYAQMVSGGLWKDYSLNISKREISFNIYKRTAEFPVYKISKNLHPNNKNDRYFVKDKNNNLINQSNDLESLIKNVRWKKFKLVNQN